MRLVVVLLFIRTLLSYHASVEAARILCFFSFPSVSHQSTFQPIWRALASRGHELVVVTPNPLKDSTLVNLTEIDVSSTYKYVENQPLQSIMSLDKSRSETFSNIVFMSYDALEEQFKHPEFQKLLKDGNQKFDLIIIESIVQVLYGLAHRFKAPMIAIMSLGLGLQMHDSVGNPSHPVTHPDIFLNYNNNDMDFWKRWDSFYHSFMHRYTYYYKILPRADEIAKKYFGEDMPYIGLLEKNISMQFTNVNPIIYPPRPNVPAVLELYLIHLRPTKNLTEELKEIVDGSKRDIVYFSFGSNVKSVNIDDRLKRVIVSALAELPYTFIWKWEADHMPGKPDNVIIKKWLPQQDLLAHPKVKAFVTQGGLQSAEEAIANGVPMVGIPFFGDQPMNVVKLAEAGVAIHLDKDTVTKEELKNAILEVVQNPRYREKVAEVRNILFDQPMKSIDKAVWWIEYVIRHKGAKHLRSPSLDLPLYQYFLLDVIGATLLVAFVISYVTYRIVKLVLSLVFKSQKVKRS